MNGKRLRREARRGDRRRARARARGPQVPGPAARLDPDQERHARRPRPLPPRAADRRPRRARRHGAALRALKTVPDDPDRITRAVRRQPAEGRPRALAAARVQGAAARRAHARRRRRRQGRDLQGDRRPRPRGLWCSSCPRAVRAGYLCTRVLVMRGPVGRGGRRRRGDRARTAAPCRRTHRHGTRSRGRRSDEHPGRRRFEKRSLPPKPRGRIQLQEYALVGVVALILIVGAILEPDTFLTSTTCSTSCARPPWRCGRRSA